MVVAAALGLFAGFTLLYAGIRGTSSPITGQPYWRAPWQLVIDWATIPAGENPAGPAGPIG